MRGFHLLILYSATIFVSATLLFLVQPMFARMVLPMLGGSPAVWNTAMVFFQAALLAGYAYAHGTTTWLGVRRQSMLHLVVMLLPLAVLPLAIPAGTAPPSTANPVVWVLGLMAMVVGLPFLVVSTTSPLIQKWFAATGHRTARDPYFLYAASNLGSMLALLSYPALLEPAMALEAQTQLWRVGYILLILLTAGCALTIWRLPKVADAPAETEVVEPPETLTFKRRLSWVLFAFVPSSLMLSVTTYLSTDLAAIPLLWIIPLALYLLTFIIAFSYPVPHHLLARALPILVLPLVIALCSRAISPLMLLVSLHLGTFFIAALACHTGLAEDRPTTRHLTEFYLWMSFGGVLGGAFNALAAPVLFNSIAEYPIVLSLACFVGLQVKKPRLITERGQSAFEPLDLVLPLLIGLLTARIIITMHSRGHYDGWSAFAPMFGIPALFAFSFSRRPLRFALSIAAILFAGSQYYRGGLNSNTLYAERSFFGVYRVRENKVGKFNELMHGTTLHGEQSLDPKERSVPLTYYHRTGPIGDVMKQFGGRLKHPAVVGLGTGSMAAYGRPGQEWTFYEIDPTVERIARNDKYFTYLRDCKAPLKVVLGDARLQLQKVPRGYHDLIALDAYSSDAIPIHLLTREALKVYMDRLAPGGVLAFHISNRHFDLEPVIANLAKEAGYSCLTREDNGDKPSDVEDIKKGKSQSTWMVVSRSDASAPVEMLRLAAGGEWKVSKTDPKVGIWTDSFSSILSVFNWK